MTSTNSIVANAIASKNGLAVSVNSSYSLDDLEKINGLARESISLIDKIRKDIHGAYRTVNKTDAPKDVMDTLFLMEKAFRDARTMGLGLYRRLYNAS